MGYRGEDLDLRTPQGWNGPGREQEGGAPNWWTRSTIYAGGRADPIWVDDTVLSACNHAFDLAAAHRAGEVRLEHLLHAMSLDEASAAVLEHRGIRTGALRRDTAAAIADLPPGQFNGAQRPRKSEDVEEVLRHAADRAYPRGTPITIDDLLHVMFDSKRDAPGLALLYRHAGSWSAREERPEVRLDPLPHLQPRPAEYRYTTNDEIRTRAAQSYFGEPRDPRDMREQRDVRTSPPPPMREPSYTQASYGSTNVDAQQNMRLEGLERAFKDLSLNISDERKTFQSFLTDLKRNYAAQTDDTSRFRGGIAERLGAMEDMLQRSRQEGGMVPSGLGDRLAGIEHALESFERAFSTVLDRISGLERQLASREMRAIDLTPVEDRISSFERNLLQRVPQGNDLASVTELLSGIETRAEETAKATGEIGERLLRLERALDNRTAETGRTVSFVGERLRSFEEQLAQQKQQSTRIEQLVTDKLGSVASVAEQGADQVGRVNTALETVTSNQRMLASAFDQWRLDAGGDLGVIDNRVQTLEATSRTLAPQIEQLANQVAVVHAVLAKREANRSHLRNWLFGTDDWYNASWNTEKWRQTQSVLDEADARLERARAKPVGNVPVRR